MASFDQIPPLYSVYYYTDFLYKVVRFKRSDLPVVPRGLREERVERFSSSYSRSRSMVLQYALCNRWDYFITITVNPALFDRYDLDPIYDSLYAFFKYYRSSFSPDFCFLLVPELHKDGAWHFHGLVSGVCLGHLSEFIPGIHPQKLIDAGYLNWGMLGAVVGYVSLSKLRSPVGAAFYVTKYITKEHANDGFYKHLYFHSRGLSTARPVADCYTGNSTFDSCLTFEGPFCDVGWFKLTIPDFTFPLSIDGVQPRDLEELLPVDVLALEVSPDLPVPPEEFIQLSLSEWSSGVHKFDFVQ